jgi:hypothetical protein
LAQLDDDATGGASDRVAECGTGVPPRRPETEVTKMRNVFHGLLVGGVLVLVAGCGGSGTTGSTATAASVAPAAESSGSTDAGAGADSEPSAEASVAGPASEAPAVGGGGGGPVAGVCELVTPDELAGIFGVASVKMTVFPGPPDNCIVESDSGDPLTAWSLTTAQASALYEAFTVDSSTVVVNGIGDKAAIVQNTGLMVLKGNSLLVISISGGADMSEDEANEASKQIGAIAAGRM